MNPPLPTASSTGSTRAVNDAAEPQHLGPVVHKGRQHRHRAAVKPTFLSRQPLTGHDCWKPGGDRLLY
jgi:hypothetical protein